MADIDEEPVADIHVTVSTYTAPLVSQFIREPASHCKFIDMIFKELLCVGTWTLQIFVMRKLMSGAVPWETRAVSNWQVKIIQVVAVCVITSNLSEKIETACDLIPSFCKYQKRHGGYHWQLLLCSFNGLLMAYFALSIVYNSSCAIAAAQLTTQALGFVFSFGVVLMLDTLFGTQFAINRFWFNHPMEDHEGQPLKDKDGNAISVQVTGSWDFVLGYAHDEDEEDDDPDHLRIVGNAAGEDPSPILDADLLTCKEVNFDKVMRQIIRISPIFIILAVFTSTAPSTFGYCRTGADMSADLNIETLVAENRHPITTASDCATAARIMGLSDSTVSGSKGICSVNVKEGLRMTEVYDKVNDRALCQNRVVAVPIRSFEFKKARHFSWWSKLTFARNPPQLCTANNMHDIDDTEMTTNAAGVNETACDKALATLELQKYPLEAEGFPTSKFASCLGKSTSGSSASSASSASADPLGLFSATPVGVCKSAYHENIGKKAVEAR